MRIANDPLTLSGTDMSIGITSDPIWLGHIANYSIQIVFTGTPVGSFKLQMSNDDGRITQPTIQTQDFGVINYTDIADSNQAISAAGNHAYTVENAGYRWVRLVYTPTSGSGTITVARFNIKGI